MNTSTYLPPNPLPPTRRRGDRNVSQVSVSAVYIHFLHVRKQPRCSDIHVYVSAFWSIFLICGWHRMRGGMLMRAMMSLSHLHIRHVTTAAASDWIILNKVYDCRWYTTEPDSSTPSGGFCLSLVVEMRGQHGQWVYLKRIRSLLAVHLTGYPDHLIKIILKKLFFVCVICQCHVYCYNYVARLRRPQLYVYKVFLSKNLVSMCKGSIEYQHQSA